jgi:hypothetical protein
MVPELERNSDKKQLNKDQTAKTPSFSPFFVRKMDMKDMDSKSLLAGIVIGFVIGLILGILIEASFFIV